MSQAEELLNSLSAGDTTETATEGHIVIGNDRFITVPEELKRIGVQYDHNIETVTFDCPRYWDGIDMSKMRVYINYMNANGEVGCYLANNIIIDFADSSIMHFDWTISRNVTMYKGNIRFIVCIRKVNEMGNVINDWNSELSSDMFVSEGLESQTNIEESYPDIITSLLERMDAVEAYKVIDTTLTKSGIPADSKTVGNKVNELQGEIDNIVLAASGSGDVTAEVVQARVNASGTTYKTLKARLDYMDRGYTPILGLTWEKGGITNIGINYTGDTAYMNSHYRSSYFSIAPNTEYNLVAPVDKTLDLKLYKDGVYVGAIGWGKNINFVSGNEEGYTGRITTSSDNNVAFVMEDCLDTFTFEYSFGWKTEANIFDNYIDTTAKFVNYAKFTSFRNGTVDPDGNIDTASNYTRIVSEELILIPYSDIAIELGCDEGYKYAFILYDENEVQVLNSGWQVKPFSLIKDDTFTYIRFQLAKTDNSNISLGEIDHLTAYSNPFAKLKELREIKEGLNRSIVNSLVFVNKAVNPDGSLQDTTLSNRLSSLTLTTVPDNKLISLGCDEGYKYAFILYDENEVQVLNSGWLTEPTDIIKDTTFTYVRFQFAKVNNSNITTTETSHLTIDLKSYASSDEIYKIKDEIKRNPCHYFSKWALKSVNHMGYNTIAPANTLPAFKLSKKQGFDIVETDVQFTKDSVPVVIHDNRIDKYSNGTGKLRAMTFEEVRQYDFGSWKSDEYIGTKIPSFDEFIKLCRDLCLSAYVEIKADANPTDEELNIVCEILKKYDMEEKVMVMSFELSYLQKIAKLSPRTRLGYLLFATTSASSSIISSLLNLKTSLNEVILNVQSTGCDKWIELCKDANIPLEVWTVDDLTTMQNLAGYVSGVTSNSLHFENVMRDYRLNE